MVCEWGMSALGQALIRRDVLGETSEVIRREVTAMCDRASREAQDTLARNRALVEAVVAALLDSETIDQDVIARLDAAFPAPVSSVVSAASA